MNPELWDDNDRPLAFLITFRTFGTWLHGDERRSVDRHGKNIYGAPKIEPNDALVKKMSERTSHRTFLLDGSCRPVVGRAIKDVCRFRSLQLFAINVRTNHVHTVASAKEKPEVVMNAFKGNATRELRKAGLIDADRKIWSRGGSTRYLWRQTHLDAAIEYVLHGQGDDLPDFV